MKRSTTSFANWWKKNLLSSRETVAGKTSSSSDSPLFNSPFEKATGTVLLLLVVSMPLALGSTVTRPGIWFAHQSILALVVAAWGFFWIKRNDALPVHPIILLPLAMAGFSVLQMIPLPPGVLEIVAPASDRLYHQALDSLFLYGNGQWRSTSMAVPAGISATLWLLLASAAALMASYLFARRRSYKLLLTAIAAVALVMAFIGFAHMAVREGALFGIIAAPPVATFFHTTLINNNNAAAYLGMASLLLLGLALHDNRRQFKLMYAAMSGLCGIGLMLTLSRGSIIVFVIANATLAGLLINGLRARLATLLFIACVIASSLYLASDSLSTELGSLIKASPIQAKMNTWDDAIGLVLAAPVVGVGFGAYASSIGLFSEGAGGVTRAIFPENIILQLFGEFGVPAGIAILFVLIVFLLRTARRTRPSRTMAASAVALIYVLMHDIGDFALMIPAIFLAWVLLFGALNGKLHRQQELSRRLPRISSARAGTVMVVLALLHFSIGTWAYANNQKAVQLRMHKVANDTHISEQSFESSMNACISLYPADYYLRMLASEHYRNKGWSSAAKRILHLKKAIELNSISPLPRRMLGRAWIQVGDRAKAHEEFSRALQFAYKDRDLIKDVSLAGVRGRELADMFPRNIEVLRHSTRILREMGNENAAAILYEESIASDSDENDLTIAACALASLNRAGAARKILERLEKEYPKSAGQWQVRAALMVAEKRYSEALQAYDRAIGADASDNSLILKAADIALKANDAEKAGQFLSRVRAHDRNNLALYFYLRAEMHIQNKKYANALTDFTLASNHAPQNCNFIVRIADVNLLLGHTDKAAAIYVKAAECTGGRRSVELRRKADNLRKATNTATE